jgi:ribonuclease Z
VQELELAGIKVRALSVGGIETCIQLPTLKVAFDIGRAPREVIACATVLFTHAHVDHLGGVAYHAATRELFGMSPPTYVVPRANAADLERLFEAWRALDRSGMEHRTVALEPGEEHVLPNKLVVRPFRSIHVVPCQGYALWSRRTKLKPEFQGLGGEELRALREQGRELNNVIETPEVAFTGDTRIEVVEREEVVRRSRLLILESTFVDEKIGVAEARSRGHVHLDEIAERAELFQNEAILLTHFSARHKAADVLAALDAKLPAGLRERVTPLLGAHG